MLYYIYKICCDDCDYVYVGSTRAFARRKNEHKNRCIRENYEGYNIKLYQTIRENGGWNNWRMVCVEEMDVENRRQAQTREEYWRVNLKATLNMVKSHTTNEEIRDERMMYYEKNKSTLLEQKKEYYINNREKIVEQKKQMYSCECGSVVRRSDLAKHKKSAKHQAWEWRQTALCNI